MAFMEKEITKKMTWFQVETDDITRGIVSYPSDLFTKEQVAKEESVDIEDVKEVIGWSVYDSPEAAEADLDEYYGDEEEDEDESNEDSE